VGREWGSWRGVIVVWLGLMRPEVKRFSGESQQNAAGRLEDLGVWG